MDVESIEVHVLPDETKPFAAQAMQEFDGFNSDNDPCGEHDCATLDVAGQRPGWNAEILIRAPPGHTVA